MQCAISGSTPQEAVISKTGYIFERRLLESVIEETGKCPISGEPLTRDDIMPIKASKVFKPPRSVTVASLPQMLGQFQDEWDGLVLETHKLKQDLETCQQELSQALYQHDAACRVIARLQRERDEARDKLQDMESTMQEIVQKQAVKRAAQEQPEPANDEEEAARPKRAKAGITQDILDTITNQMEKLSTWRRAKKYISPNLAKPEKIRNYVPKKIYNVFQSSDTAVSMDFHENQENVVALAGGQGIIKLFDLKTEKLMQELDIQCGAKQAKFLTEKAILAVGEDGGCRVGVQEEGNQLFKIKFTIQDNNEQKVSSDIAVHPTGMYYVSAYDDGRWSFNDVTIGQCLASYNLAQQDPQNAGSGYLCSGFHPDGLIFALGCNNKEFHIWEMRNRGLAARFQGHDGIPIGVVFSENGIHMATTGDAGSILLWDLRKFKSFHKIIPYQGNLAARGIAYDKSGRYLACTGSDSTKIYGVKQDYGLLCGQQGLRSPGGIGVKFQSSADSVVVGGAAGELMVLAETDPQASTV
eukprot:TRINITY_DN4276_c0_g3_i3.p1 TRINITY_DN4276_c0_g3~~TRINITY_DN4276_c0_g3_i3.p1  ORF type:complete len:541 (-),score=71.56 TRINITY_DN4276_c0_g3_i3:363-1943(-)